MTGTEAFFAYARERYSILLKRRQGLPKPWTADTVLQRYSFCNVFREDDVTTKWIRKHITPDIYGGTLLGATIIARWFNRISTLERLLALIPGAGHGNLLCNWYPIDAWKDAMSERLKDVKPLVTGAYIIKTPNGMIKLKGLLQCLGQILPASRIIQRDIVPGQTTLEGMTANLAMYPYLGPFMAYEIVTDLRHSVLSKAPDIMTWANSGPGAARGAGRVNKGDPTHFSLGSSHDRSMIMGIMQMLLAESTDARNWPNGLDGWPAWEMRDVEHTLCEFDKYERGKEGGSLKRRYNGTAPADVL